MLVAHRACHGVHNQTALVALTLLKDMSTTTTTTTAEQLAERYATLRVTVGDEGKTQLKAPLPYKGAFDKYTQFDLTPAAGRQFGPEVQLSDLLKADDGTLQDLAHIGQSVLFE